MTGPIAAAIDRKRLILSILALILIAGGYAYSVIPKEDNPDVQFPFFSVNMSHDGISPEDAERMLIRPMEQQLQSIDGLKEMTSRGFLGGASVVLEFHPDVDPDRALRDVREAVDMGKAELPEDTDEPRVNEYSAGESPILTIVLFGTVPERAMVRIADDLKDRLESLPEVLEVGVSGKREEVLEIVVDPIKLETYNVAINDLLTTVQNNNRLVAAGTLDSGAAEYAVKVPGLFETAADVADIPIRSSRDGVVTLADLGDARRGFKDATSLARFNGRPAITLEVVKRAGTNTVETAEAAKRLTSTLAEGWPSTLEYEFIGDSSVYVRDFLGTLRNSVLSAVALVAIVIVAALGARSAALVGIAIPGSFLFGILMLMAMGYTINTVVLFGLILAVGLLVDGAIVVSEYADRKMLEGESRRDAFRIAAERMSWPIIAATLTTLAAFLPLVFWPGVMGDFMSYLPVTVMFTLAGSLMMALIFLPTLGAGIGRPGEADPRMMRHLSGTQQFDPRLLPGVTGWYTRMLARVVRRPITVLGVTLAALAGTWALYYFDNNGQILFPDGEPNSARVLVHARGNLSLTEMNRLMGDVERRVTDIDGGTDRYTRIGAGSGSAEDTIGRITLLFQDWDARRPAAEIEGEIRRRLADVPGVRIEFREQEQGPVQGKAIEIEVASATTQLIAPAVARLREKLESMDGLVDIEDSRPVGGIEWRLGVDRAEAGRFGTNITVVGSFIQLVTNGALVGRYRPDGADDEVDIRVRLPAGQRGLSALDDLRVPTEFGLVPVSNFVGREPQRETAEIERIDGKRVMTLAADVAEGVQAHAKVEELRRWLADASLDPRLEISFAGEDELERETGAFLGKAFWVAFGLMAIILLAQFNSFYQAGLILTAVLLSTVGVVFGLWATGRPFVLVMTGVGIIALAGIVVNNNIVLIDTYDRLVKQGTDRWEAILRTGAQRLRPVMLTTITTIVGLMPMVFQMNVDFIARSVEIGSPTSFVWVDLALAIVFGLAFATVLTLVVTPSLLGLGVKAREWRERRRVGRGEPATEPAAPAVPEAAE